MEEEDGEEQTGPRGLLKIVAGDEAIHGNMTRTLL